ncbi:hypothetical protein EV13_1859 [Prochlorococcus sp. MIT 0702]|nr:hypothetical protein EV13_1859 [Prochlorococcus sp. MIT 0702]KGG29622.1 hypothetical protein EV12_0031 [Prochlorococcus sp. MIT 0701]KGG34379.1 hypothetical protein EV14_1275 [Prochlorococcus sp. MIT 0703]
MDTPTAISMDLSAGDKGAVVVLQSAAMAPGKLTLTVSH